MKKLRQTDKKKKKKTRQQEFTPSPLTVFKPNKNPLINHVWRQPAGGAFQT